MFHEPAPPRKFGPKTADHPSVGQECYACRKRFQAGDYTTLIPLGPGDNPEAQEAAREGRAYTAVGIEIAYTAVGIEIHFACATGLA